MRRLLVFASAALLALGVAGSASAGLARWTSTDTETLELVNASGLAVVDGRGALFGHIDKGTVRITDLPDGADTTIVVAGADWRDQISEQTKEYRGQDVTFRVLAGTWRVKITADGIDVSAVLRGSVGLEGTGRYSIDGAASRRWPDDFRVFPVGS
jgi:hypothetical protein